MNNTATARQIEVFKFIQSTIKRDRIPPTIEEAGKHFGITRFAAALHVEALAKKGFIEVTPATARGIKILKHPQGIPVVSIRKLHWYKDKKRK